MLIYPRTIAALALLGLGATAAINPVKAQTPIAAPAKASDNGDLSSDEAMRAARYRARAEAGVKTNEEQSGEKDGGSPTPAIAASGDDLATARSRLKTGAQRRIGDTATQNGSRAPGSVRIAPALETSQRLPGGGVEVVEEVERTRRGHLVSRRTTTRIFTQAQVYEGSFADPMRATWVWLEGPRRTRLREIR